MRGVALVSSVAVTLLTFSVFIAPTPAGAADPPGTRHIGSPVPTTAGVTSIAAGTSLLAMTSGDPYRSAGPQTLSTMPLSGGTPMPVLSGVTRISSSAADMLLLSSPAGQRWYDLSTGTHGTPRRTWDAAAPDGGVVLVEKGPVVHLIRQSTTGATSDLGVVPDLVSSEVGGHPLPGRVTVLTDARGVAVVFSADTDYAQVRYQQWATPGFVTVDATGVSFYDTPCYSLYQDAIGCAGDQSLVMRLQIEAAPVVVARRRDWTQEDVVVNPVGTSWYVDVDPEAEVPKVFRALAPVGGGAIDQLPDVGVMAATPDAFIGQDGDELASWDAAGAETVLGPAPVVDVDAASQITITAGRAVFTYVRDGKQSVWSAAVTRNDASLGVGRASEIAPDQEYRPPEASGTRTLHAIDRSTLEVIRDGVATPVPGCDMPLDTSWGISGTRVICYRTATASTEHLLVVDLNTGAITDVSRRFGATPRAGYQVGAQLSGDEVAYAKPDGSVWRTDLVTGTSVSLAPPSSQRPFVIATRGNWVAWETDTQHYTVRNALTMAAAARFDGHLESVSAGGVVWSVYGAGVTTFRYTGWSGSTTQTLLLSDDPLPSAPVVADGVVAWLEPRTGTPLAAPLAGPLVDRPRSLGNPVAPASTPAAGPWGLDLPTSAPLTSCAVTLTARSGAVVRTLACAAAAARQGEAEVAWNGYDDAGVRVPRGTYTWTVVAGNASGSLVRSDGRPVPVTGRVEVTRGPTG